ncbi:hypothetical protein KOW79_014130 [Hemibagrus wyckioides]|uniref:ODAD1 central coiled coil region domain-containing protein n=1 Tax=Hemibagrus wyckioides TaxID=337641 RepID=A0A9D3NJ88_9TELE|nr:hypothetical protein KOW79_014130 [Hemibagrus wyckioides]
MLRKRTGIKTSSLDFDALEEKASLKRQYKMMQGDLEASKIHFQDIIRKQCLEENQLRKECKKLEEKLRVPQSQRLRQADIRCVQQLRALLKRRDELDKCVEKERLIQVKLEQKIQSVQKKLEEHKRKAHARHTEEVTHKLENKLERTLIRHNKKVVKKHQLKEEIEKLQKDHVHFQQLHHCQHEELQKVQQEIAELMTMMEEEHDVREKILTKLENLKEKNEKNKKKRLQQIAEVDELKRQLEVEQRLDKFIETKCRERKGLEEAQLRREMKKQQLIKLENEALEDLFRRLREVTGEEDLEMLVTKCLQREEKFIFYYRYLTEQRREIEDLKAEIRSTKEEMEKLRDRRSEEPPTLNQQRDIESQIQELTEILDQLNTGVSDLYHEIGCDPPLDKVLSCPGWLKDSSLTIHLRLLAQKTSELVAVQNFIKFKDQDQELAQVPALVVQPPAEQPLEFRRRSKAQDEKSECPGEVESEDLDSEVVVLRKEASHAPAVRDLSPQLVGRQSIEHESDGLLSVELGDSDGDNVPSEPAEALRTKERLGKATEEKASLKRQYKMMQGDLEASKIHFQDIIRKQCLEENQLRKECKKLEEKLRVPQSQRLRQADIRCVQQLRALLKRRDELDKRVEKERLIQVKLEQKIQSVQKKLEEHKRKAHARHTEEVTHKLENKLERTLIRHNKKVVKKHQLKEEIEKLQKDHVHFQQLHHCQHEELQKVQQEIAELMTMIEEEHDVREKILTKLENLKEKNEKNKKKRLQQIAEVDELKRQLEVEQRLDKFIETKCRERKGLEEAQLRRGEEKFIFYYRYLTEQRREIEDLKAEIRSTKEEMEKLRDRRSEEPPTLNQQRDIESQIQELTEILDQLNTGVSDLYHEIGCDPPLDKVLSCPGWLKDSSLTIHLRLLAQKTSELVAVQNFIKFKDQDQELAQVPALVVQPPAEQPLEFSDMDQVSIPDYDKRPLTLEELRQFVTKMILEKEKVKREARVKRARLKKSQGSVHPKTLTQ